MFLLICLATFSFGCAGFVNQPSSVRPPSHPLLGAGTWLGSQQVHHSVPPSSPNLSVNKHVHQRLMHKNIARLNPRRFANNSASLNLLRAIYADTPVRGLLGRTRSVHEVKALGTIPSGPPQVGDVFFFKHTDASPSLAVVKAHRSDGITIALAPVRGQLREVRIHMGHRSTRRRKGVILNSFIRIRRPGDGPKSTYLAGELVAGLRRLLPASD